MKKFKTYLEENINQRFEEAEGIKGTKRIKGENTFRVGVTTGLNSKTYLKLFDGYSHPPKVFSTLDQVASFIENEADGKCTYKKIGTDHFFSNNKRKRFNIYKSPHLSTKTSELTDKELNYLINKIT